MQKTKTITVSPEILASFLSSDLYHGRDKEKLKDDPKSYISENYHINIEAMDMRVVENSAAQVHLALPYYSLLDSTSADTLTEAELEEVAAGEFFIAAIILAITATVVLAPAIAMGAHDAAFVEHEKKYGESGDTILEKVFMNDNK